MFSLLGHSREEEDSGMEGGLVVGYMQINSLGAGRDCGTHGHGWGRRHYCVRATTALFSHLIINSIDAHLCFSLSLSLNHSLLSSSSFSFALSL